MEEIVIQGGPPDIHVFVGPTGFVCMKQFDETAGKDVVVMVHRGAVKKLVDALEDMRKLSKDTST